MLNLNSVMIGTQQPQELAAFYEKVIGKAAEMVDAEQGFWCNLRLSSGSFALLVIRRWRRLTFPLSKAAG